jgi:hypothetical protein
MRSWIFNNGICFSGRVKDLTRFIEYYSLQYKTVAQLVKENLH